MAEHALVGQKGKAHTSRKEKSFSEKTNDKKGQ